MARVGNGRPLLRPLFGEAEKRRWRAARPYLEFVDDMGLILIAKVGSGVSERKGWLVYQCVKHRLEAEETCEPFGRYTDTLLKSSLKLAQGETTASGECTHTDLTLCGVKQFECRSQKRHISKRPARSRGVKVLRGKHLLGKRTAAYRSLQGVGKAEPDAVPWDSQRDCLLIRR